MHAGGDRLNKKEMIAMLLAGGQGSRLGILTANIAKPAVPFGGKYRIIDFPLSNCVNSGIDTVGIVTQYQPYRLHSHIGIGIPWDLDRTNGGISVLPPYEKTGNTQWYTGTANAIFQNMRYIDSYSPDYVLILSGDHIYKMDYEAMLDFHKESGAQVTIASMPVSWEEASRFGIILTDEDRRITGFEEKPEHPRNNLASMGIYIFDWPLLKEALIERQYQPHCDFGKHIIPYLQERGAAMFAYEFQGYWKDVGTLYSYWKANMELIDLIPEFNLYEEYWKIYTNPKRIEPLYISAEASVERSLIGASTGVYGTVSGSIIGANVHIGKNTVIRDSIVMRDTVIEDNVTLEKCIVAEGCHIGKNTRIGMGDEQPSIINPEIYNNGLVTIGDQSVIPADVLIGKNCVILGATTFRDYPNGVLPSGGAILKAGEVI